MNDELKQLEEMLRRMPLKKPPASLDAKVLGPKRRVIRFATLGAAAAVIAIAITLSIPEKSALESSAPLDGAEVAGVEESDEAEAMELTETFSDVTYEGLFVTAENKPVHVFRRRMLERTLFVDPKSGYQLETVRPDEELLFVAAEVY